MDALDVKISQIKNLDMVYLYSVDSIFTSRENKYLGLKVVYNSQLDYICLDFKDRHFGSLINKVVSRYNQEKDNRNIILLGDLSKRLFESDEIQKISNESKDFNKESIGIFNTPNEQIRRFNPYLKEAINLILKYVRDIDGIILDDIKGFNKKFIVTYQITGIKKEFPMILYFADENTLKFRIGAIEGENLSISGSITNTIDTIKVSFESEARNIFGAILYEAKTNTVEKVVKINDDAIYHTTESETVLNSDISLINFYLDLFGIKINGDVIKTDDQNFIFGTRASIFDNDDSSLIENSGLQLSIEEDEVNISYIVRNSISKYRHLMNVDLDYTRYDIKMKKRNVFGRPHILVEKTSSNSFGKKYDYVVYEVDDIDFKAPFDVKSTTVIDEKVKSLYDIEKRIGGIN